MTWANWPDGERMKIVRSKINDLGGLFSTAIAAPFEHTQGDLNAGLLDDSRLISPAQLRQAVGYQPFNPQSMPVAVANFSRLVGDLVINQSFGVASIATGSTYFTVTLAREMNSSNYPIILNGRSTDDTSSTNDNSGNMFANVVSSTAFRIYFLNNSGAYQITKLENLSLIVFGDLLGA